MEIIDDVREKCGTDFPLIVRLTVDEMYAKSENPVWVTTFPMA